MPTMCLVQVLKIEDVGPAAIGDTPKQGRSHASSSLTHGSEVNSYALRCFMAVGLVGGKYDSVTFVSFPLSAKILCRRGMVCTLHQ